MARREHIHLEGDFNLVRPFPLLLEQIDQALLVATPATRAPVSAGWVRFPKKLKLGDLGPGEFVAPTKEKDVYLTGASAAVRLKKQTAVDQTVDELREMTADPFVGFRMRWCPNFGVKGRHVFDDLDLSEDRRELGHEAYHYIHAMGGAPFEANKAVLSFAVALPFSEKSPALSKFLSVWESLFSIKFSSRKLVVRYPGRGKNWQKQPPTASH